MTEGVCYGLELDPKYVDVIVPRWRNLAGKEATLEGHGASFEQVKLERREAEDPNRDDRERQPEARA